MADITQSSNVSTTSPTGDLGNSYLTNTTQALNANTAASSNIVDPTTGQLTAAAKTAYDPNALQTQAFTNAAGNVGNYIPGLSAANTTVNNAGNTNIVGAANPYLTAGTSSSADLVGGYMNPYIQNVVDQIRLANQNNIQQNLAPGLTAGAVGGGQFGSQRGANALSLGISNANIGALSEQTKALQSGYAQALAAAQAQRAAQMRAADTATTATTAQGDLGLRTGAAQAALAKQLQAQGLADTDALLKTGTAEQDIAKNRLLSPLDVLGKTLGNTSGVVLPTSSTSVVNMSPLSQIGGIASLGAGMFTKNPSGTSYADDFYDWYKKTFGTAP
jgi:hypothetical protein